MQQKHPRQPRRRLHRRHRRPELDRPAVGLRVPRRAPGAAGRPAGRPALEGLPGQAPPRSSTPSATASSSPRPSPRSDERAGAGRHRHRRGEGHRAVDRRGARADGMRIVVADLKGAEEAATAFPDGVGLTVDVADELDVERMAAETRALRAIDILVNNAGLYASLEMRPFERDPRRGVAAGDGRQRHQHVPDLPRGRAADAERGGGRIVNISSGTPFRGVPFLLHYVTSKGAIVALTRALAKELGGESPRQLRRTRLHDERRRRGAPRGRRGAARGLGVARTLDATRSPRTSSARSCSSAAPVVVRHRPDHGHRRRPVLPLRLSLTTAPAPAGPNTVTRELEDGPRSSGRSPRTRRTAR